MEFRLIPHAAEVERIARGENDDLLGEVTVIGVVQTICAPLTSVQSYDGCGSLTLYEVSREHLHSLWSLPPVPQSVRCDHWIFLKILRLVLRK
jgi:hypothetical protein